MPIKRILAILTVFTSLAFAQDTTQTQIDTTKNIVQRKPRGLSLADKPDSSQSDSAKTSAGTSGNVKYGMKLEPVEEDTTSEDPNPNVEKRLITQNDSVIVELRDSIMSEKDTVEENVSYANLFEKTQKAIEDTMQDYSNMSHSPHLLGWVGGNFYDKVDNYNRINEEKKSLNPNVGFGLLFPITNWFGIKGELSYMTTLSADTAIGYNSEKYCILKEEATLIIPITANFMIRPRNLLFDLFAGGSFMGVEKNVFALAGSAVGRKVGKNGYLFADARLALSEGEKYWSVGIGYEFIPPYSKDGRGRHSIVPPPDTFTVVSRVNNIQGGRINPSGEYRFRVGSPLSFEITTNEGYTLDSLIVNDTIMTGEIGTYNFPSIENDINILAMFNKIPAAIPDSFNVAIEVLNDGGTVSPTHSMRMEQCGNQEFTIATKVGFLLDSVVVNGVNMGRISSYKIECISEDIVAVAYFNRVKAIEIKQAATVQDGINYQTGSAKLAPSSYETLNGILAVLQQEPNMRIEIAGHTDISGSHRFNVRLSKDRAQSVVDYLIENGISADRLVAVGFGPDKPIADNRTEEGRSKNRRTEIRSLSPLPNKIPKENVKTEEIKEETKIEEPETEDLQDSVTVEQVTEEIETQEGEQNEE